LEMIEEELKISILKNLKYDKFEIGDALTFG